MNENSCRLGEFIREQRINKGYSQFQFGRLVGVSDRAVSKWENGTARPRAVLLPKICKVLNVSYEELLSNMD